MSSYGSHIQIATSSKKCIGLSAWVLVLLSVLGPGGAEEAVPHEEFRRGLRTLLTEWSEEAHRHLVSLVGTQAVETSVENSKLYLDSVFGQEKVESVVECVRVAIQFLSEGAASGLNVIAAYVTEILKVTGINVSLPFPHFTPEGVASVTQWALLALIGYWVLSLTLQLVVCALRRILWLLKLCVVAGLFAAIVSDTNAPTDTTALRLAGLVLACALLGLGRTGRKPDKTGCLGAQLRDIEDRLKEVEQRKTVEE